MYVKKTHRSKSSTTFQANGWCLGVDHCKTEVLSAFLLVPRPDSNPGSPYSASSGGYLPTSQTNGVVLSPSAAASASYPHYGNGSIPPTPSSHMVGQFLNLKKKFATSLGLT